jgi:hypothetical protein
LLDRSDTRLSRALKRSLARKIELRLGLDTDIDVDGPESDPVRQDAFFLCRAVLIGEGKARYAEQFEGLYAMMRGLTAAFALGTAYYLGIWLQGCLEWNSGMLDRLIVAAILLWGAAALSRPHPTARVLEMIGVSATVALAGAKAAASYHLVRGAGPLFGLVACLTVCIKCYDGYRFWAEEFAKTVWRDYSILDEKEIKFLPKAR